MTNTGLTGTAMDGVVNRLNGKAKGRRCSRRARFCLSSHSLKHFAKDDICSWGIPNSSKDQIAYGVRDY